MLDYIFEYIDIYTESQATKPNVNKNGINPFTSNVFASSAAAADRHPRSFTFNDEQSFVQLVYCIICRNFFVIPWIIA